MVSRVVRTQVGEKVGSRVIKLELVECRVIVKRDVGGIREVE